MAPPEIDVGTATDAADYRAKMAARWKAEAGKDGKPAGPKHLLPAKYADAQRSGLEVTLPAGGPVELNLTGG